MLRAENISYRIDDKYLLAPTTVDFAAGYFHVIMGANGAGKSTLVRLLSGDLVPHTGKIFLSAQDLATYKRTELARKRAVLSQHYDITFPITVDEIILLGRYPYFDSRPSQLDLDICMHAKEKMQVEAFSTRDYLTLSGGEAQKVQMCRVLAQIGNAAENDGKVLFLDEPVSHLDLRYQYQLLKVAKQLCTQHVTVIAVLHDVNLALSFADRMLFMKQGKVAYDIHDHLAVSPAIIEDIFDVRTDILYPEHDRPVVIVKNA